MKQKLNQRGQGLIEYLILVALIAVGTIAAVRVVGNSVSVKLSQVAKALGATVEGSITHATVNETTWKKHDLRDFMQGSLGKAQGEPNSGKGDTSETD